MIPKDLSAFTVEQLRGFATAIDEQIAEAKPTAGESAENLSAYETLVNEKHRLATAINAAFDAARSEAAACGSCTGEGEGEGEGEAATTETETEGETTEEGGEAEGGEGEGEGEDDAETRVDDAVASASVEGAGTVKHDPDRHVSEFNVQERISFLRNATQGNVIAEHRQNFATMRRETNHVVRHGGDATAAIQLAIKDRMEGNDKTAAGCFCGPDDARNEICTSLSAERPLSDTFPTITGGDFRFIRQIDIADALTGVAVWTCDDQALVDPEVVATWKPCFELDCELEVTSETYAVSACASFNVQALIGNPALIENLEHVMTVAHNQVAELEVYARLLAQASQIDYDNLAPNSGYGASAKVLKAVAYAMELIASNFREPVGYNLVLPAGLRYRILVDGQIRGMDDYRTWSDFTDRLRELGVNQVVELLDPTAAPTPLPARGGPAAPAVANPLEQTIILYKPESFLLGVAPEVNLGVTRSPELARQNKLQWFVESFESLTRICIDPTVALIGDWCDSGVRPALGEGDICGFVEA